MSLRRRFGVIAVLLALGSLANIGIAWAIALWSTCGPINGFYPAAETVKLEWPYPVPSEWPRPVAVASSDGFGIEWKSASANPPGLTDSQTIIGQSAGWPFRTMYCYEVRKEDSSGTPLVQSSVAGGIVLRTRLNSAMWHIDDNHRRLPLLPRWPGFLWGLLLNAGVLAALFIAAPRAFSAAQRRSRTRRALCPDCGYPRSSAPTCAECGGVLPNSY